MMNYYGWGMNTPFLGLGWILGVLFWVFLALLIAKLVGFLFAKKNEAKDAEESEDVSALEILKMRYAKGEITKKEFDTMKKDILSSN